MTKTYNNYEDLLTFTRASKGHALRPVSYGDELSEGNDFSSWDNNSTYPFDTFTASSSSLTVANSTSKTSVTTHPDSISLVSGRLYVIDLEFSIASGTVDFSVREQPTATVIVEGADVGAGETQQRITFVSDVTALVVIQLTTRSGTVNATLDNISVKEVTFDESDGTLTLFEHPTNIPRVEYDADGNRLGLLVEDDRTNLVTYSEDFSEWSESRATINSNVVQAPDGTTTGSALVGTAVNDDHAVGMAVTTTAQSYTFSVFVKAGDKDFVRLWQINDSAYADFDLENITVGSTFGSPTATSIEDAGNGWRRCSMTSTATVGARTFRIYALEADNDRAYLGDGSTEDIYIWGAQVEAGAFPTSYIKTTGSTATRSADVASIPVADFGYNQSAFTVLVEASHLYDTFPAYNRFWELSGGGDSLGLYGNAGGSSYVSMTVGGVSQINFSDGAEAAADANTFMKYAIGLKTDDFDIARDGSLDTGDTSITMPDAIDTLSIGMASNSTTQLNGHIKSIKYYPRRLTNAQLQDLTS